MVNLTKELKGIGINFLVISILYVIIAYFNLVAWQIILLLTIFYTSYRIYTKAFTWIGLLKSVLYLSILIYSLKYLEVFFGGWGYVIGIIIICGIILYSRRKKWLSAKYHIERMIWGKPLKEFIANKEKPPKIKLGKKSKESRS